MKFDLFVMSIIIIIYTLIFLFFIGFHFYSYLRFKIVVKSNEAILLMDKLYEISIWVTGFLFLALYISEIVELFLYINQYNEWKLPFIVYAMPLMGISFKILVNEGLYAYSNNKLFIGKRTSYNIESIKIESVHRYLKRAKIIISIDNAIITKNRKYVIRTSLSNLHPFLRLLEE